MLIKIANHSPLSRAIIAGLGACLCIALLSLGSQLSPAYIGIMAPFGATMVILFALPQSPLAQPRNILGGHTLTAVIGVLMAQYLDVSPLSLGLAVGLGISAMMLTHTLHPPAGATPLLIMLTHASWAFVWSPVISGCLIIIGVGWLYHRFVTGTQYPKKQG